MRYLVGMVIWFNGSFITSDNAALSPLDAGLQHGVGLFETLQAKNGKVFRLLDHLERLRRSAMELELMSSLHIEPLAQAVGEVVAKWGESDARIRITLTGGVVNMLRAAKEAGGDGVTEPAPVQTNPTLLIVATAATPFPAELFERGVGETLSCGTGACAAVVTGIQWGLLDPSVLVHTQGGDLTIAWQGGDTPVWMTGPATTVFQGEINLPDTL